MLKATSVPSPNSASDWFVDCLTLAYHEARNVRHLIRDGAVDHNGWEKFVSLPTNREAAWASLQTQRSEARAADSPGRAERVFVRRFGKRLSDLVELSEHASWRSKAYGGNAWAKIGRSVEALGAALEANDEIEIRSRLDQLRRLSHNTGRLVDKLKQLDEHVDMHR